jgi:hypothetical protein
MKRALLFVFAIITAMSIHAEENIRVKSGDVSVIKKKDTASLSFDYSTTVAEGQPLMEYLKERGDDYVRDWPDEKEESEFTFLKEWNHKNKKGLKLTKDADAAYRLVVTVEYIDFGSFGQSFFIGLGAGGAKMSGKAEVFEKDSDTPLLTLTIKNQTGGSQASMQARLNDLYEELAEDVLNAIDDYDD